MTKDNDSNADLDLNLDDFDLEGSSSDLSMNDPDGTGGGVSDQAADDDSVELEELFGPDDDFDFSKKEEVNLNFDDHLETSATVAAEAGLELNDSLGHDAGLDLESAGDSALDGVGVDSDADGLVAPVADAVADAADAVCLLYTSPSPRDRQKSRMPSSA